jgi:serine/threonine protein kinase
MVARTIGKYRIVEKVGRGGMGTVYRAVDESLERDVAIKILNSEITEPEVIKRFRAEALTLARLNHPGIAVVYELYQENGDLFMVMEFVRGQTFQQLSERAGQLPLEQVIALGAQALDALAYAHRLGIVHRDLKPSNLMLSETGVVKIMDFGIARIVGSEHLTGDGSMMGTPAYMSPEQVRGSEVDGRADLYAIAVVLYRLLAARLPFEADTAIAFAQKQLNDPPTPLKTMRPDLPASCEAVLTRALEKSRDDRFQTAEEFKQALVETMGTASLTRPPMSSFISDATTCTLPTPLAMPRELVEPRPLTGSRSLTEPTTQRTVVISGKYFFAGTALIALLLVALLVAVVVVARRPLGIPGADQIAARLAPSTGRAPAPAPAPPEAPAAASPAAPVPKPPARPSDSAAVTAQNRTPPGAQAAVSTAASKPLVSRESPPVPRESPAEPAASTPASAANPSSADRRAVARALPPVTFDSLKLLVMDGTRSREQDATIHLSGGRIIIIAVGERLLGSLPYEEVLTLSSSRSRRPRWRNADGTESGADLGGGAFGFLKSDRTWLAIQTRDHTYVVRAARDGIESLAHAASDRTGLPVVKVTGK